MPGRRDHLQLVGGRRLRVRPQPRMQVATQAIFAGPQDHRVFAMTPEATGRRYRRSTHHSTTTEWRGSLTGGASRPS